MQSYSHSKTINSQSESFTDSTGKTDSHGSISKEEFINDNGQTWSDSKSTNWEKPADGELQSSTTHKALE
jgi:hypothetical protein